jgi:hypothetical protein
MIATDVPLRLTRVVTDHDCGVEIVQMQSLTERIQKTLPQVSAAERDYIANALLTFALRALSRRSLRSSSCR